MSQTSRIGRAKLGQHDPFDSEDGPNPTLVFEREIFQINQGKIESDKSVTTRIKFLPDKAICSVAGNQTVALDWLGRVRLENDHGTAELPRWAFTKSVEDLAVQAGATPRTSDEPESGPESENENSQRNS